MNSKIYCKPPFSCCIFAQAKQKKIASYAQEFFFCVHTKKKRKTNRFATNDEKTVNGKR
jgi:hypothetical protein